MSQYLEEAAEQLRKAGKLAEEAASLRGTTYSSTKAQLMEDRERIARGFAQLAAIDRGLIPAEMVGDILAHAVRAEVPR